jgi:hypothetical protein
MDLKMGHHGGKTNLKRVKPSVLKIHLPVYDLCRIVK